MEDTATHLHTYTLHTNPFQRIGNSDCGVSLFTSLRYLRFSLLASPSLLPFGRESKLSLHSLTRRHHFYLFTLSCSPPSGTWCVGAFSPSGYVRFARSPEVKYGSPPPGMTAVSSFFIFHSSLFTSARTAFLRRYLLFSFFIFGFAESASVRQYLRFSFLSFLFSLP